MKKECPIIYIHKGTHKYLETSIKQSLKNNKEIILIGDKNNEHIAKKYKIKHVSFDDNNTNDFKKYYIHDTTQNANYGFELICFQRWFVLLEVMKKLDIEKCLYLDSDILFYGNIETEFKRISNFGEFNLAFPGSSGHSTYIFSKEAMKDFCNFMYNCYTDKTLFLELSKWAKNRNVKRSDMSIFQLYKHKHPNKVFDLTEDHGDGIVYDKFINFPEGYKSFFGKKYFTLKNNKAYIYKDNKELETKTLHFQMHMKSYMGIVYKKQIQFYKILLFFNAIVERCYYKLYFIRFLRKKRKEKSMFN